MRKVQAGTPKKRAWAEHTLRSKGWEAAGAREGKGAGVGGGGGEGQSVPGQEDGVVGIVCMWGGSGGIFILQGCAHCLEVSALHQAVQCCQPGQWFAVMHIKQCMQHVLKGHPNQPGCTIIMFGVCGLLHTALLSTGLGAVILLPAPPLTCTGRSCTRWCPWGSR